MAEEQGFLGPLDIADVREAYELTDDEERGLCAVLEDLGIHLVAIEVERSVTPDGASDPDPQAGYHRAEGRTKLLTRKQEGELAYRAARGDNEARSRLILANIGLVVSLARRYRGRRGLEFADLMQEGLIGLIKAVDRFDPERGYKLSTYATWWIRKTLFQATADQARTVRLPLPKVLELNRALAARRDLAARLGREPTDDEVAAEVGMPDERVRDLLRLDQPTLSLDARVADSHEATLGDFVADDCAASTLDAVAASLFAAELNRLIAALQPDQRAVIRLRYGIGDEAPMSLGQAAAVLGMSPHRVRQIERETLEHLNTLPEAQSLKDAC